METVNINFALEDKKMLERMIRLITPRMTDYVLDVGTGPGGNTALALAPYVREVLTIDANAEAVKRFQQKLDSISSGEQVRSKIRVETRSTEALKELDSESADVITCRAAFHHFSNPTQVLTQIYRILKPAGRFEMMDPIFSEYAKDTWVAITKMKEYDLENMYTYQEYLDMVTKAGFDGCIVIIV